MEDRKEYRHQYYLRNKKKAVSQAQNYYQRNKDRCKARNKARYAAKHDEIRSRMRQYYAANKAKWREGNLKKHHGVSLSQYIKVVDSQNGCCGICGVHQSKLRRPLALDHCHSSGKIRGVLCDKCNLGLGLLGDTLLPLVAAVEYLKRTEKLTLVEAQGRGSRNYPKRN